MKEAEACIARAEAYRGKTKPQFSASGSPFDRAESYAMAARPAEALDALTEAYQQRNIMMPMSAAEPSFAALRGNARFEELPGKMGLK